MNNIFFISKVRFKWFYHSFRLIQISLETLIYNENILQVDAKFIQFDSLKKAKQKTIITSLSNINIQQNRIIASFVILSHSSKDFNKLDFYDKKYDIYTSKSYTK